MIKVKLEKQTDIERRREKENERQCYNPIKD